VHRLALGIAQIGSPPAGHLQALHFDKLVDVPIAFLLLAIFCASGSMPSIRDTPYLTSVC
jgi:hypothetical protein